MSDTFTFMLNERDNIILHTNQCASRTNDAHHFPNPNPICLKNALIIYILNNINKR